MLSAPSPLGVGTPYVEALSSYVQRLAVWQGSLPSQLLHRLLAHVAAGDATYLGRWRRRTGSLRLPSNINGFGHAHAWLETLKQAFGRADLHPLTIRAWDCAFPCRHVLSAKQRICSDCLCEDETPYHRLLWCIDVVRVCPVHNRLLSEQCPCCERTMPVIHPRSRILLCPWCGDSLTAGEAERSPALSLDDYSIWVANEIGRLLSKTTNGRTPHIVSGPWLRRLCRQKNIMHAAALGASVGTGKVTAWNWWNGRSAPSLPLALRICRSIDAHLVDALFADSGLLPGQDIEPVQLQLHLPRRALVRKTDWDEIHRKLLQETARSMAEVRSLATIASGLNVSIRNLRTHEPELCRQLGRRFVASRRLASKTKYEQLRGEIAQACIELRNRGCRITSAKVASVLEKPGLFCRPTARRALAEVLQLDYRCWPASITVPGMLHSFSSH